METKILLVEDDTYLREGLYELLTKEGYSVYTAASFNEGQEKAVTDIFSLFIFDVMLPDGSGVDLCKHIRTKGIGTPILFLTACDEEFQIVRGLDSGADDYVTKPFRLQELLSRIRALLRRQGNISYCTEELEIDIERMSVRKNGEKLFLTPTEFQILNILISNKGTVPRNLLLEKIWDCDENFIDDNTLSVHISRLREKVGNKHIQTVRGIGYRWEE
ncbi:MAG: response regulator transcription factor [Ruminococcaceae bacterium]|nr:response regulator transcription factor [Oscillospiraceae bacterium]MBR3597539.1 response regulator transcription factor [Clostridia bacterium]